MINSEALNEAVFNYVPLYLKSYVKVHLTEIPQFILHVSWGRVCLFVLQD